MKKIFHSFWSIWKKLSLIIGDFVSTIILTIFYFTIFALVAIPHRIFTKKIRNKTTNFVVKKSTISTLKEFKEEF